MGQSIKNERIRNCMNNVKLIKISEDNFIEAFHLKLGERQENYVSTPIRSLAQAYVYYNQCTPFGIYVNDNMVGYVMIIYDYDLAEYNIWHMMIDCHHQRKGYGQKAIEKCLDYIKTQPFGLSNRVVLTCNKENTAGIQLYRKFGFIETGNMDEDEIEFVLTLQGMQNSK